MIFQKTFGGSGWDKANNIDKTNGSGYIIAGSTSSFGTGNPYFIRINLNGDTLWTKVFNIAEADKCKIIQADDGAYIISGSTTDFGAGNSDVLLIKCDTNFNIVWTKSYGGISNDFGRLIQQTSDSGFIIIGFTQSYGAGFHDFYFIKTDVNGDTLWTRTYGGIDTDRGFSIQQTAEEGFIITGKTSSYGVGTPSWPNVFLIYTDANGDILWTRTYGGVNGDEGYSVLQTADSGFIVLAGTGSFSPGGVYLIRTDANGDTLWTRTYGDACSVSTAALAFDQTSDGGYILCGYTCYQNAFTSDGYLLRLNSNGNVLWSKSYRFGSNMKNAFYDVKQTTDGGFIAVGETGDPFTSDVYVVKTDANGNSGCNDSIVNTITGGAATIVGTPATLVGSGAIVGNTTTIVGSTATVDSVLCFDTLTGINENFKSQSAKLKIYPNPFLDYTIIEAFVPQEINNPELVIYNLLGVVIKKYSLEKGYNILTTTGDDLPTAGIYFCTIRGDNRLFEKGKMVLIR